MRRGCHAVTGYVAQMDVITWIRDDLVALQARLDQGVIRHVPADRWRHQVDGGGSTLHHLLLHLTRHHDLAVQTAITDRPPLFLEHQHALGLQHLPVTVGLAEAEDRDATAIIDHDALLAYAEATVANTLAWVGHTGSLALDTVPPTSHRLTTLAHVDVDRFDWLHRMWADRPVAWLVQWPVIGHGNAHIGEMVSIRNRMGLSPF
jgi:hypothetical protein